MEPRGFASIFLLAFLSGCLDDSPLDDSGRTTSASSAATTTSKSPASSTTSPTTPPATHTPSPSATTTPPTPTTTTPTTATTTQTTTTYAQPLPIRVEDGFETGFAGWTKASQVPPDPNNPGYDVEWSIVRASDQAHGGSWALNYALDGSQDDGTIWIQRAIPIEAGRSYSATVHVHAWSSDASFNHIADCMLYLGVDAPWGETAFPVTGASPPSNRSGLREALNQIAGWKEYSFTWTTPTTHGGTLYAAFGVSVVWETEIRYYLDDVFVELQPN